MEIASIRQHPRKLTPPMFHEMYSLFLKSAMCGMELEGNSPGTMVNESCGYDRSRCGACLPENCPLCRDCTPHSGDERCGGWNSPHTYCAVRIRLSEGEEFSATRIRTICRDCNPCPSCHFECNACNPCDGCNRPERGDGERVTVIEAIAKELGVKDTKVYDTNDLTSIKSDFIAVYYDGSVNTELVTKPFQLFQLEEVITRGIEVLSRYKVRMHPDQRAGCHQTFSFAQIFPDIVARNVVQLIRYYLPALLSWSTLKGTEKRGDYRRLPRNPGWGEKCETFNQKYEACFIKNQLAMEYQPKMIEFRYPDMHTRVKQHMWLVLLNAAIILKAMRLSTQGVVSFHNFHWDYVEDSTKLIYSKGAFDDGVKELRNEMLDYLGGEIHDLVINYPDLIAKAKGWSIFATDKDVDAFPRIEWRFTEPFIPVPTSVEHTIDFIGVDDLGVEQPAVIAEFDVLPYTVIPDIHVGTPRPPARRSRRSAPNPIPSEYMINPEPTLTTDADHTSDAPISPEIQEAIDSLRRTRDGFTYGDVQDEIIRLANLRGRRVDRDIRPGESFESYHNRMNVIRNATHAETQRIAQTVTEAAEPYDIEECQVDDEQE